MQPVKKYRPPFIAKNTRNRGLCATWRCTSHCGRLESVPLASDVYLRGSTLHLRTSGQTVDSARTDLTTVNPYAVFPSLTQPDDGDIAGQPIVLQGELGLGQLLRTVRLGNRSHVWQNRPYLLMALIALSLLWSVSEIWLYDPQAAIDASLQAAVAGLAIFALTCLDATSLLKFSFYIGRQKPQPFRCTISDSGVKTELSRLTLDDPWSRFSGFSESEDLIVLRRKAQYIPLPKAFSADEGEWQRLRDVLHTRLPLRRS